MDLDSRPPTGRANPTTRNPAEARPGEPSARACHREGVLRHAKARLSELT
jgi:hypothetical protein